MSSFKHIARIKPSNKPKEKKCYYCSKPINSLLTCKYCKLIQPSVSTISTRKTARNIHRIFVLTLTGKESRIDLFKRKTLKYLKDYECFPYVGVDGRNKTDIENILNYFYSDDDFSIRKIMKYRDQHPGSIGCHLSHMSIWSHALQSKKINENFILILEDDATFEPYGIENIELTIDRLMYLEWDILYLGHGPNLKGTIVYPNILIPPEYSHPESRTNCGFWGYVIRTSSIPQLISSVKQFETKSIDATIQYYFGKPLKPLFLVKPIVKQSSGYSVRMMIEKEGTGKV